MRTLYHFSHFRADAMSEKWENLPSVKWRGCAIAERFRSDDVPSPILQPQSDTNGHKAYVLFVFFVAKNKRNKTMKLNEAIRGMEVKSWERRENSDGKCTVYVRFVPKGSAPTVSVKEVA